MPVITFASSKLPASWERIQKRIEERRSIMESARSVNVKRLQQDIEKIAQREVEFARKVVQEIIPIRVTWNEEAVEKLKAIVPIQVEVLSKESAPAPTEPVPAEKLD